MKTSIKIQLVAAFIFGTLINYANNNVTSSEMIDAKKVKVEFILVKKGHKLSIKDEVGSTIYSQKIKITGDYSKIYDFHNLDNGKFTIELEKDYKIVEKTFLLEDGKVKFLTDYQKTIFKPVIRNEKDLILISKLAFDKEPLEVILYYNNEVIFTETIEGKDVLERAYRVSEDKTGDYTIVVRNVGRRYIKNFSI